MRGAGDRLQRHALLRGERLQTLVRFQPHRAGVSQLDRLDKKPDLLT